MARTLPLLDAAQRRAFDRPPPFQPAQRRLFFTLPEWATQVLATLVAPHSRGGFVLQVGYFKEAGRFFLSDRFPVADQACVQQRHDLGKVKWARYDRVTRFQHRQLTLQHFGVLPFEQAQETVLAQVTHLARQQMNPAAVFRAAAFVRSQRIEVPTFATLATPCYPRIPHRRAAGVGRHSPAPGTGCPPAVERALHS